MARHASPRKQWRPSGKVSAVALVALALVAAGTVFLVARDVSDVDPPAAPVGRSRPEATTTTASTVPPTTTTTTRPAGPGFNAGQVTAVGDSVMLDYQDPLKTAIAGINVDAAVSRQWSDGEADPAVAQGRRPAGWGCDRRVGHQRAHHGHGLRQHDDDPQRRLAGRLRERARRSTMAGSQQRGARQRRARYPNAVVADWATLAAQNPGWFGSDGTHLAIDGPGADALAQLVATTLSNG